MSIYQTITKLIPQENFIKTAPQKEKEDQPRILDMSGMINITCWMTDEDGNMQILHVDSMERNRINLMKSSFTDDHITPEHRHSYIELAYVEKGTLRQIIDGKIEVFDQGEICLIGQNCIHSDCLKKEDSVIFFFGISAEFFDKTSFFSDADMSSQKFIKEIILEMKEKYKYTHLYPKKKSTETIKLFEYIVKERIRQKAGYKHLILGSVERILSLLVSEYDIALTENEYAQYNSMLFDDLKSYIDKNYRSVSAKILSKKFFYSPDYINKLIKKFTGHPYSKYLQHVRLEKAKNMLITTPLSVEDIAHKVGYTNLSFFYNIFHEKFGCTPNEMRKK